MQTWRSIFAGPGADDLLQSQTHLAELSSDGHHPGNVIVMVCHEGTRLTRKSGLHPTPHCRSSLCREFAEAMCHMCHKGAARLVAATTGLAKGTLASDLSAQLDSGAADRHAACAQNCSSIPSAFTLARSLGYALPWPENWAGRTDQDARMRFKSPLSKHARWKQQSKPARWAV